MDRGDLAGTPGAPVWAVLGLVLAVLLLLAATWRPEVVVDPSAGPFLDRWLVESVGASYPGRGTAVLNALLLAAAAIAAARFLGERAGSAAPVLVALLVAGSVIPGRVFAAGPEILLLAAAVGVFALAFGGGLPEELKVQEIYRPDEGGARLVGRWLAVGALLAPLVLRHPVYLVLLLPALAAVPRSGRRAGWAALAAGLAAAALALGAIVGIDPATWWSGRPSLDPGLVSWNLLYAAAGANVGLLPCFPALVLLLACKRRGDRRGALLVASLAALVLLVLLDPHGFHGGTVGIGGFVPLYGALWLLPTRTVRWRWIGLVALLSGLSLWPLWLAPREPPETEHGPFRYPSTWARSVLPHETTLRHLPPLGEWRREGLWARSLDAGLRVSPSRLALVDGGPGTLLVASREPLAGLRIAFGPQAGTELEVSGASVGDTFFHPDRSVGFRVALERPRARHPLPFDPEFRYLYQLTLRMRGAPSGAVEMALVGERE